MGDHTTVSIKKSFLEKQDVQQAMDELGIDSASELCRYSIRNLVHENKGSLSHILQKVLAKADLTDEQYQEIIQEVVQETQE